MTLETCYKQLEVAKASKDAEVIAFWEARIERKKKEAKYQEIELKKDPLNYGKKSKR
jgi:hypothetical protein